jgi:Mg-chelatase subunit ChlD
MADFTATVYQNEFLPDGGTDVHAIVTVDCSGAGAAGQSGSGDAGEIIIVDTSGSMGADGVRAAAYAAQTALDQILDGV